VPLPFPTTGTITPLNLITNNFRRKRRFCTPLDYVLDGAYTLLKMRSSHETVVKIMTRLEAAAITILSVTDEITEAAKALSVPCTQKSRTYLQISSILRQPGCSSTSPRTRCFPPSFYKEFGFIELNV